ncbi:unnamed protein product [Phytophthora fragariaefolia]|uniref:Unnamed protein product n=1 Tax=Phytophthora fragariaefolia TaxID=1490495 RepID=A0A9W6Y9Q4_9STRA|nr:unnamed protein product [Phytophthora fragariaefolia]
MAAAAAGGLDAPGLSPSDLQLNARSGCIAVSSTSAPPPPSPQVTLSSLTQALKDSIVDLALVNSTVSWSVLAEALEGADSSGVESSSTSKQTEAASTLASLSGATHSGVIRALPPGKHPACSPGESDSDGGDSTGGGSVATPPNLSNKLVESSDSSVDRSTLADPSKAKSQAGSLAGSHSPSLVSPTAVMQPPHDMTSALASAAAKVPVASETPPPARSPARSLKSVPKSKSASKAKAAVPARSAKDASKSKPAIKAKTAVQVRLARNDSQPSSLNKAKPTTPNPPTKDGSQPKSASKPSAGKAKLATSDAKAPTKSDGGVPPHRVDVRVLVARAAASTRLDSRESGPMKRLRDLPFFLKGSKLQRGCRCVRERKT